VTDAAALQHAATTRRLLPAGLAAAVRAELAPTGRDAFVPEAGVAPGRRLVLSASAAQRLPVLAALRAWAAPVVRSMADVDVVVSERAAVVLEPLALWGAVAADQLDSRLHAAARRYDVCWVVVEAPSNEHVPPSRLFWVPCLTVCAVRSAPSRAALQALVRVAARPRTVACQVKISGGPEHTSAILESFCRLVTDASDVRALLFHVCLRHRPRVRRVWSCGPRRCRMQRRPASGRWPGCPV
jgi:hypothetical protein